ncbi:MAG: replicative DNA helicase, partial [Mucinivorans sp.]
YYGMTTNEDGTSTAGLAEIIFAKHRNGALDVIKLRFRAEQAKFVDWDDSGFGNITSLNSSYMEVDSSGFDDGFDDLSAAQGRVAIEPPF